MLRIIATLIFCLASQTAFAAVPAYMVDAMGRPVSAEAERAYWVGLSDGLGYANAALAVEKKPRLFCAPQKFVLSGEILKSMASHKLRGPTDNNSFAAQTLIELEAQFPCN